MLRVYVEAPFAAFRTFTAGWYRPTATFLTPSAAYGLVLNLAGVQSRLREGEAGHDGKVPATLTRPDLPSCEIAVGVPAAYVVGRRRGEDIPQADVFPRVQSVYQQLHNYPVGASGKERAADAKGNKYNITPVRREFLSDLRAVIALRGNDDLEERVCRGLAGEFNAGRYGVPFLGDNAFLIDRIELLTEPVHVRWYERITSDTGGGIQDHTARLTVRIDRANLSATQSALFAPSDTTMGPEPSSNAWSQV